MAVGGVERRTGDPVANRTAVAAALPQPRGGDALRCQLQVPVALQRALGQPDRFADQAFAQAAGDGIAELIEGGRAFGKRDQAFVPGLDVRLADAVPQRV